MCPLWEILDPPLGTRDATPLNPNYFVFMQFSANFFSNNRLSHPLWKKPASATVYSFLSELQKKNCDEECSVKLVIKQDGPVEIHCEKLPARKCFTSNTEYFFVIEGDVQWFWTNIYNLNSNHKQTKIWWVHGGNKNESGTGARLEGQGRLQYGYSGGRQIFCR